MVTFLDIFIIQKVANVKSLVMEDAMAIKTILSTKQTVKNNVFVSLQ